MNPQFIHNSSLSYSENSPEDIYFCVNKNGGDIEDILYKKVIGLEYAVMNQRSVFQGKGFIRLGSQLKWSTSAKIPVNREIGGQYRYEQKI